MWAKTMPARIATTAALAAAMTIGTAGATFAADTTTTAETATSGTMTGTWGAGCSTISVTTAGWPAGTTVHVRWYASATTTTPGVDGETLAPTGTTWSTTVDPSKVRGFSYRIAAADGTWLTPFKDEAASCVTVTQFAAAVSAEDCDTLHVTASLPAKGYRTYVDVKDATGAVVTHLTAAADGGVTADGRPTYAQSIDTTVDLPAGTYSAEAGIEYAGKLYPKAVSGSTDLTGTCAVTAPEPTPTTTPAPVTGTPAPTTPAPTAPVVLAPQPTGPATQVPAVPEPATRPATPVVTAPARPVLTRPSAPAMVTRTFQVDRYTPRTSAQARVVARLDDDGRLRYREDRALWGASSWQFVTVRVPRTATPAQVMAAVNAKTGAVGDVTTTATVRTVKAGRSRTIAWELGRGAGPKLPWGARNNVPQTFFARG